MRREASFIALTILGISALAGCASTTQQGSRAEVKELRDQVAALRAENTELKAELASSLATTVKLYKPLRFEIATQLKAGKPQLAPDPDWTLAVTPANAKGICEAAYGDEPIYATVSVSGEVIAVGQATRPATQPATQPQNAVQKKD